MRVVVGYQWAASPKEATVLPDGTVTWTGARRVVGVADRVAIELACQLAQVAGARAVGVTVCAEQEAGPRAASAALACGLDEVVLVACEAEPDTSDVAAALAAVVRDLGDVTAVVLGDCAADSGTRMVAPVLGGLLGWPVLTDVRDVTVDGAGLQVVDESRGVPRSSRVEGPAVLAATVDARLPRQLGLREIMAAGSKPSTVVDAADHGVRPSGSLEVLDRAPVDLGHRQGRVIAEPDAERTAAVLVEVLMEAGVL